MSVFKKLFSRSNSDDKNPFYVRATMVMLGLFLFFYILLILRGIIVPLLFAALLGVLLNPLVNWMMRKGVHKIVAIVLALLIAVGLLSAIITFIISQVGQFVEMAPEFSKRADELIDATHRWIRRTFNIPIFQQKEFIDSLMESSKNYAGKAIGGVLSFIASAVLIPIYIFLLLYYKPLFLNFFYEVFDNENEHKVADVLSETKGAIQGYIVGLLIETAIIAALNSAALLILGVKYAVLLGIIGAVFNLIPYIGGLIAIALPLLMSIVTNDGGFTTPLLIIVSYSFIQFFDNNILVPRIVSSQVDVNAFVTIVIVLLGGAIWGVSGMFLAVPFIAVCKIIFDRVPELQPWGKVLGVTIGEPPPPREVVSEVDEEAMD